MKRIDRQRWRPLEASCNCWDPSGEVERKDIYMKMAEWWPMPVRMLSVEMAHGLWSTNVWKKSVSHFFQQCCNRHRGRSLLNQVTSSWFAALHMSYMVAKHWLRKSTQPRTIRHSSCFCFSIWDRTEWTQDSSSTYRRLGVHFVWHLRVTRAVTRTV